MKNIELILNFIKFKKEANYSEILLNFQNINESTLVRNLNKLVSEKKVQKTKT
jgi:DNA-binding HxlR family transcriptional regulator